MPENSGASAFWLGCFLTIGVGFLCICIGMNNPNYGILVFLGVIIVGVSGLILNNMFNRK